MVRPAVKRVDPDRARWGEQLDITIHGDRFDENVSVEMDGPADIKQMAYLSSNELRGRILINDTTPHAHHDAVSVTVRNPGQCGADAKLDRCIEIVPSTEGAASDATPPTNNNGDTPRRLCQRKGTRYEAKSRQCELVVLIARGSKRLESELKDESSQGLGVILPDATDLSVGQQIRVIFRRAMIRARVRRIWATPEGVRVGLRLEGKC